jgi:hypothetical protein
MVNHCRSARVAKGASEQGLHQSLSVLAVGARLRVRGSLLSWPTKETVYPPSGIDQSRFPRETSPYSLIQSDGILPTLPPEQGAGTIRDAGLRSPPRHSGEYHSEELTSPVSFPVPAGISKSGASPLAAVARPMSAKPLSDRSQDPW